MTKREFLAVLQRELCILPQEELKMQLSFYGEMIDDRIEDGMREEEAVASIGSISEILLQVENKNGFSKPKQNKKEKISAGALTLLILGSPIWVVLIASALVTIVSLYAIVWCCWICLCAAEIVLGAGAVAGFFLPIVYIPQQMWLAAVFVFGAGLFCLGAFMLLWYGCKYLLLNIIRLTKWSFLKSISFLNFRRD